VSRSVTSASPLGRKARPPRHLEPGGEHLGRPVSSVPAGSRRGRRRRRGGGEPRRGGAAGGGGRLAPVADPASSAAPGAPGEQRPRPTARATAGRAGLDRLTARRSRRPAARPARRAPPRPTASSRGRSRRDSAVIGSGRPVPAAGAAVRAGARPRRSRRSRRRGAPAGRCTPRLPPGWRRPAPEHPHRAGHGEEQHPQQPGRRGGQGQAAHEQEQHRDQRDLVRAQADALRRRGSAGRVSHPSMVAPPRRPRLLQPVPSRSRGSGARTGQAAVPPQPRSAWSPGPARVAAGLAGVPYIGRRDPAQPQAAQHPTSPRAPTARPPARCCAPSA
jgi:translation initiation factor IF-2